MKKAILLLFVLLCSFPCFSQVINDWYFPENNEIDAQYKKDMQSWITNYEWQNLIGEYISKWEKQMYLEMERLISLIPESEKIIRENQKKWEESVKASFDLVADNVNFNQVGREDFIGGYSTSRMNLYRERTKYYLCLYYTIIDQKSDGDWYTDTHPTELAK